MMKIITLILALVLCLSFCACDDNHYTIEWTQPFSDGVNNIEPSISETTINNNGEWDEILCSGDDYYLVKKTIDTFDEYKLMLGVINSDGEWVQQLTDKGTFVDWVAFRASSSNETLSDSSCFAYLGDGVFLASPGTTLVAEHEEHRIGPWNIVCECLIWNVVDNIQTRFDSEKISVFQDGYVFFREKNNGNLCVMNKKCEIVKLPCKIHGTSSPMSYFPIYAEGLFFAYTEENQPGFFDINGNLVINLSEYNLTYSQIYFWDTGKHTPYFENGKATILTTNQGGSTYKVIIDKTGAIVGEPEKAF